MDVEITPEPSGDERTAILLALELERASIGERSAWWRAGLETDEQEEEEDY